MTPTEWLASRIEKDANGCWLWTRSLNTKGYAQATMPGAKKGELVHRWAYRTFVAPIPDRYTIDHLCRVRRCVNPAHLEAVTNRENSLRSPYTAASLNSAKTHCKHGHEFTPENTRIKKRDGSRVCRTCQQIAICAFRANRESSAVAS